MTRRPRNRSCTVPGAQGPSLLEKTGSVKVAVITKPTTSESLIISESFNSFKRVAFTHNDPRKWRHRFWQETTTFCLEGRGQHDEDPSSAQSK